MFLFLCCYSWFYNEGDTKGDCSDGLDNDRDQAIDCADIDCQYEPHCKEEDSPDTDTYVPPTPSDDPEDTSLNIDTATNPDTGLWPEGDWVVLASGGWHNCAVRQDTTSLCWGRDDEGQLEAPTGIAFREFALGNNFSCGLAWDSRVSCWGEWEIPTPEHYFKRIVAGVDFICGLDYENAIQCWGGEGTESLQSAPQSDFVDLDAGAKHVCGLTSGGNILCWGDDSFDQLNSGGGEYIAVGAGFAHSCGITIDQRAECWGTNVDGATDVPPVLATSLVVGLYHSCITNPNSQGICWGGDSYGLSGGLLGNTFEFLTTGNFHTCGLSLDSTIVCYGDNTQGQLLSPE